MAGVQTIEPSVAKLPSIKQNKIKEEDQIGNLSGTQQNVDRLTEVQLVCMLTFAN